MFGLKFMGINRPPFMEEDPVMYMDTGEDMMDDDAISMMEMIGGPEQAQTKIVHTDFFNEFEDDFDDDDLN